MLIESVRALTQLDSRFRRREDISCQYDVPETANSVSSAMTNSTRSRSIYRALLSLTFLIISNQAASQTVTESWLRQAGITCGGGLSVDVQGEIGTAILKRFSFVQGEGQGQLQLSETERLLKQFRNEEKRDTYVDYVNCMLQIMSLATETSGLPPREVVLDSPVAVAALETIKRGQRFVMVTGDSVAISGHQLLLTVNKISTSLERSRVHYTWSDSESGASESNKYRYQGESIAMGENCTVTPYKIDADAGQVSFLSNC